MSEVSGSFPKSCCQLPPIQAEYTPKGSYSDFEGFKTYLSGPEDAKAAVLMVYDVFGFSPQIIQGADLLASQGYRVVMPDFCKGTYCTPDMFDGSEAGTKKKEAFFAGFPGAITTQAEPVAKIITALKGKHAKLGAVGYCWGYKVLVTSPEIKGIDALAGAHPSFPAADDADKICQPLALLPSQGEDMKIMNEIFEAVEKKAPGSVFVKHFDQVPHGWMAARGDLKNEPGLSNYKDGYQTLSNFYKQYL